jgi:hypothetical protein
MFLNWFKSENITEKQRLNDALFEINKIKTELKDIQNTIEKLEIKALESRKLYHKKLKEIYGEEEPSGEKEKDIYKGVFLPDDGIIKRN